MTCVREQVKGEMAIPMGGEEHMDTSHYPVMEVDADDKEPGGFDIKESAGVVDGEPSGFVDGEPGGFVDEESGEVVDREPEVNSYVSIKLKGAGRPIHIRMDEPQLAKTQVISTMVADVYRPENVTHQLDARIGEIADKKTGFSHEYTVSSEVGIESSKKKCQAVPVDWGMGREESIPDPKSAFTAQDEVVSIQNIVPGSVSHLNSDSRSSPGKVTRKQKTSSRKTKHGKQSAPYIKQLLSSMQNGKRHYVEHNGIKHLVQINLIPVEEDPELETSEESIIVHNHRIVDENAGGSVDRPPDSGSGYEHMDMTGSTFVTHQQYEYEGYGEAVDYSDRALDLSDKPLDLTVRRKYSDNTMYQGQPYSVENLDSVVNSLPSYDEENTDSLPPYGESCMSTDVRGEVGEDHKYRDTAGSSLGFDDASSCCEDDGRVSVQSEDQLFDDGNCNAHVNGKPVEASGSTDRGDGNLPSLSRLTLYSANLEAHPLETQEAKYAVSTRHVDQPSPARINAEDPQVILQQLLQLCYLRQSIKVASNAPAEVPNAKVVAEVSSQSRANGNIQTSEQSDVSNIPVPAMPNFFSLEVANDSGELLVKEGERVKNNLREKLRKKLPNVQP